MAIAETLLERVVVASGRVYEVFTPPLGPFDESIAALPEGFELWLPEQLAAIRMAAKGHVNDYRNNYSGQGSWVAAEYCHDNKTGDILIAKRPHMTILKNLKQATDAHREDREFYIPTEAWTELQDLAKENPEDAMKTGVLLVRRKNVKEDIDTGRLAEEAVTYFLFAKEAKPYGIWLSGNHIKSMPQLTVGAGYAKKQEQPFARALTVCGADPYGEMSMLYTYDRDLDDGLVHAVRELSAELGNRQQNAQETLANSKLEQALTRGGAHGSPSPAGREQRNSTAAALYHQQ